MVRAILRSFLLPAIMMLGLHAGEAHAQLLLAYTAKQGLPTATARARDTLGADARLVFIATIGNLEYVGFRSVLYLDTVNNTGPGGRKFPGQAELWGYVFHSPSKGRSITVFVTSILIVGYQAQLLSAQLPLPREFDPELDMTVPYANSDRMVERLKTDTAFQRFHAAFPDVHPGFVSLGGVLDGDSLQLPAGLDTAQPIWSLTFRQEVGAETERLICFVGARDGSAFCRSAMVPTLSVPSSADVAGTAALAAVPNPADGGTRITLDLPPGVRPSSGIGMALYDDRGAVALDLTASLAANDFRFAEFDAATLPAGIYYCRAIGADWSGIVGVLVR